MVMVSLLLLCGQRNCSLISSRNIIKNRDLVLLDSNRNLALRTCLVLHSAINVSFMRGAHLGKINYDWWIPKALGYPPVIVYFTQMCSSHK